MRETRVQALGREDSPGEGNSNPLQYSCLENPVDRGAWGLQSMGSQRIRHDWVTSLHFKIGSDSFLGGEKSHGNWNTKLEHLPNQGSQTLKCPLPDSVNRLILTQTPKNENLWQMCTWSCRLACAWPEVVSGAWYYKWRTERATVYPKLEAKTVFGKYRMEKIYIAMVTNYFYTHIKQK